MKKILIAEDDKFLASAYKFKLTKADFDVKMVSHGGEALELLKIFVPDIILLDLVMPIMDGFLTLEEIKKLDNLKSIPILVASNLGQKEDIDKAISLGASDFVVKSDMSLDELIKKINIMIG